ncbi:MAG: universal stress protein, partial [Pseudomonadota bacterium]
MTPNKVLVVLNEREDETLLRAADAFAQQHSADLVALVAIEQPHDLGIAARMTGRAPDQLLTELADRRRSEGRVFVQDVLPARDVSLEVAVGKSFIEIIRHVQKYACDFVVKAAEPLSGLQRILFSSTDQHLLRKCPCPVWLRTPEAKLTPKRVIATIDLDTSDA